MTIVRSREDYYETGLDVLADLGYGGFKLAEICKRLGVTTGSFYHRFASWPAYAHELARYWVEHHTTRISESLRAEPDPRIRIEWLTELTRTSSYRTEAAIRTWSAVDPEVHALLTAVDQERFDVTFEAIFEILHDVRQAQLFASWATYLRIGYQQALIPYDPEARNWALDRILEVFYSDRFAGAPDG
ncbi:MAG TPA: TetR/AcrR family transcriptional regulator [Mycobacterium sp.]|nr:TetR/AcrR family transcriptional regulator [Mycobacterium sp.]